MSTPGEQYARKFNRLLELYPHPDGRPWKGVELEEATHEVVNSSYISALKKGQNNRPGLDKLKALADAMGFPFELWFYEPEEWRQTVDEEFYTGGDSIADRLNYLFESITKEEGGEPYSNREVALMSQGRLSEGQIREMREGRRTNPARSELLAICDVFDVDFSYWDVHRQRPPLMAPETLAALQNSENVAILHKSRTIAKEDRSLLMSILDELEGRNKQGSEGGQ